MAGTLRTPLPRSDGTRTSIAVRRSSGHGRICMAGATPALRAAGPLRASAGACAGAAGRIAARSSGPLGCLLAVAALFVLAACAAAPPPPAALPDLPARLGVETRILRHVVHFAIDSSEPDAAERAALAAFLTALPEDATVEVVAFGSADPRAGRTYNLDLAARRAHAVAGLIEQSGRHVRIDLRAVGEAAAPGASPSTFHELRSVELVARVHRAVAISCHGDGPAATRLGCTLQGNLAAMIADPAALARPVRLSPPDPGVVADAVIRLREPPRDQPFPSQPEGNPSP